LAETFRTIALVLTVGVASLTDLRSRRIPNALTLPALLVALLSWFPDAGGGGVLRALLCAVATLFVGLLFQAGGVVGGGDVKLLAAVAAFSGWVLFRELLIWTALLGGAIALVVLAWHRALLPLLRNLATSAVDLFRWGFTRNPVEGEGHKVPYATIIACGSVAAIVADRLGYRFFR
jgi:prepilin peptidase CpaA